MPEEPPTTPIAREPSQSVRDNIANRNNWLKIGVISVFTVVAAIKLITLTWSLSDFKFSDFLSLVLAIFSISLSVAFYFKATDTSNEFYHHTYEFTRDVSMILGRIEATFGEHFKHLDEHLRDMKEERGDSGPTVAAGTALVKNPEIQSAKPTDVQK